jgi:hypothetical protein
MIGSQVDVLNHSSMGLEEFLMFVKPFVVFKLIKISFTHLFPYLIEL